ncbi:MULTISPECIES: hypothetical protein [unclassified Chelatococcus]|uniref:hypothetical protein n=1 Tax=unclassified Chelatococcus TaxID=2638111 RepID=UPI001BCF548A|nr:MULTISPECIES: hypothetical protein [unclassified Chelatococcus]MBS7697831.1 hypothetical protein [Chelatococcus sp. YT9]MBS7698563.1 hypothetical protein [Chelatococcus sp. YT9]MBX3559814.1 hypothetical protein [Chelatococcus sp.]
MTNTDKERADFEAAWKERPWLLKPTSDKDRAEYWFKAGRETERAEAVTDAEPIAWGIIASNTGRMSSVTMDKHEADEFDPRHIVPLYKNKPDPSPDVEAENRQLRGTLEYILAQTKNDYPGVLSVIRTNASAALDRGWQETVSKSIAALSKPEGK